MFNSVKQLFQRKKTEEIPKPKKIKATKKTEKELADERGEPYVSILRVDLDPNNIGEGSFELDWNEFFVAKLVKSGYVGRDDSQIIDQWFQDVCRHVVLETYEQYEAMNPKTRRKDRKDGRAEYS